MNANANEAEKSTLVIRLERNQKELLQLKSKLNSYICEPTTQDLFERIEVLRKELNKLIDTRNEIIISLQDQNRTVSNYIERAKNHLLKCIQIQQSVAEYVAGVRHCNV